MKRTRSASALAKSQLKKNKVADSNVPQVTTTTTTTTTATAVAEERLPSTNSETLQYWLIKSEPHKFSIQDLKNKSDSTGCWDGVRNYQARNYLKSMKLGDKAFFYHSSAGKETGIVGEVEIVREAYPDYTALDRTHEYYDSRQTEENPTWFMVDVKLVDLWNHPLKLDRIRKAVESTNEISEQLKELVLLKNSRLSVQPVKSCEWNGLQALRLLS